MIFPTSPRWTPSGYNVEKERISLSGSDEKIHGDTHLDHNVGTLSNAHDEMDWQEKVEVEFKDRFEK